MPRSDNIRIPLAQEIVRVGRRKVAVGGLRIRTRTEQSQHVIDEPSLRETFDIKRIKMNKAVDSPPPVRQEGPTTIIPLLKEVMIVTKQLLVIEEVCITRHIARSRDPKTVTLRRQRLEIDRTDSSRAQRTNQRNGHDNDRRARSPKRRK